MRVYVLCAVRADTRDTRRSACSSFPSNSLPACSMPSTPSSSTFTALRAFPCLLGIPHSPSVLTRVSNADLSNRPGPRLRLFVCMSPFQRRPQRIEVGLVPIWAARVPAFADVYRSRVLYLDLHDVHTLQNNLFGFLHRVVQGLRKKGVRRVPFAFPFPSPPTTHSPTCCDRLQIWATYHLSFSLALVCIVRALPSTIPPSEEHEEQVLLAASKFDTSDV